MSNEPQIVKSLEMIPGPKPGEAMTGTWEGIAYTISRVALADALSACADAVDSMDRFAKLQRSAWTSDTCDGDHDVFGRHRAFYNRNPPTVPSP
jgi:hypothetical protein